MMLRSPMGCDGNDIAESEEGAGPFPQDFSPCPRRRARCPCSSAVQGEYWYSLDSSSSVVFWQPRTSKSCEPARVCPVPDRSDVQHRFYEGPFDATGLPGAADFERIHNSYNHPPEIRLGVTLLGLVFGPAGHSGTPMTVPFGRLHSVELFSGTRKRIFLVTPATANQRGVVVLTTNNGKIARFSGITSDGLQEALTRMGAKTDQPS